MIVAINTLSPYSLSFAQLVMLTKRKKKTRKPKFLHSEDYHMVLAATKP